MICTNYKILMTVGFDWFLNMAGNTALWLRKFHKYSSVVNASTSLCSDRIKM